MTRVMRYEIREPANLLREPKDLQRPPLPKMKPRTSAVAACLIDGMCNKDIARALGCCTDTVEDHLARLMRHYGQPTRLKLALFLGATA